MYITFGVGGWTEFDLIVFSALIYIGLEMIVAAASGNSKPTKVSSLQFAENSLALLLANVLLLQRAPNENVPRIRNEPSELSLIEVF